jgi:hypothetical protein
MLVSERKLYLSLAAASEGISQMMQSANAERVQNTKSTH